MVKGYKLSVTRWISLGSNVQQSEYSQYYWIAYLKFAESISEATHTQGNHVMGVIINLILVIISQCLHISVHVVYFKLFNFVNYTTSNGEKANLLIFNMKLVQQNNENYMFITDQCVEGMLAIKTTNSVRREWPS